MTAGGWLFMFVSLGIVWGLAVWSYRRVFTTRNHSSDASDKRA